MRNIRRSVIVGAIALGTGTLSMVPATAAQKPAPVHVSSETGIIKPQTSDGCNDHSCILVTGHKLHVNAIVASTTVHGSHRCTVAYFQGHAKGVKHLHTLAKTKKICGSATYYSATWQAKRNFPNGYKLCIQWSGIHGEPCITVHK